MVANPSPDVTPPDRPLNLARWCLQRWAEDPVHGATTALTASEYGTVAQWSYAEAWARVQRLGRGLLAGGLEPGDRVLVRLPPSPDAAFAFFGATVAGLVAVPAGPPFTNEMATHLAEEVGAVVVITTWELRLPGFDGATLLTGDLDALEGPGPLPETSADDAAFRIFMDSREGADTAHAHGIVAARPQIDEPVHDGAPASVTPEGLAPHWPYTSGTGLIDVWAAGGHALLRQDAGVVLP